MQQKAVELDKAKAEAENAGAGDRSLDSMSTDDLVEKMAAAPLYAALGREGNQMCDYSWSKFHFLFRTEKNCGCSFSRDSKTARQSKKKARASYKGLFKLFNIEISNFTFQNFSIVQQSLQLQTLVVMQQNPQLALLNQV